MKKIIFAICWISWFCFAYLFYGNVVNIIVDPSPAPQLCSTQCFDNLDNDFALIFFGFLVFFYVFCLSTRFVFKPSLNQERPIRKFIFITIYGFLVHVPPALILFRLFTTSADQQHGEFVALLYLVILIASFIFYVFHSMIAAIFLWLLNPDYKKRQSDSNQTK